MKFFPHCLFCFMLNRTIRFIFIGFCFKFLSMLMILLFFPVSKRKWKKKWKKWKEVRFCFRNCKSSLKREWDNISSGFFQVSFHTHDSSFSSRFQKESKKKRRKWKKVGFCFGTASHLLKESETSYHRNFFLTHQEVFFSFWSLMANKKKCEWRRFFSLFFFPRL